jgi:hypothetical protein
LLHASDAKLDSAMNKLAKIETAPSARTNILPPVLNTSNQFTS